MNFHPTTHQQVLRNKVQVVVTKYFQLVLAPSQPVPQPRWRPRPPPLWRCCPTTASCPASTRAGTGSSPPWGRTCCWWTAPRWTPPSASSWRVRQLGKAVTLLTLPCQVCLSISSDSTRVTVTVTVKINREFPNSLSYHFPTMQQFKFWHCKAKLHIQSLKMSKNNNRMNFFQFLTLYWQHNGTRYLYCTHLL